MRIRRIRPLAVASRRLNASPTSSRQPLLNTSLAPPSPPRSGPPAPGRPNARAAAPPRAAPSQPVSASRAPTWRPRCVAPCSAAQIAVSGARTSPQRCPWRPGTSGCGLPGRRWRCHVLWCLGSPAQRRKAPGRSHYQPRRWLVAAFVCAVAARPGGGGGNCSRPLTSARARGRAPTPVPQLPPRRRSARTRQRGCWNARTLCSALTSCALAIRAARPACLRLQPRSPAPDTVRARSKPPPAPARRAILAHTLRRHACCTGVAEATGVEPQRPRCGLEP